MGAACLAALDYCEPGPDWATGLRTRCKLRAADPSGFLHAVRNTPESGQSLALQYPLQWADFVVKVTCERGRIRAIPAILHIVRRVAPNSGEHLV